MFIEVKALFLAQRKARTNQKADAGTLLIALLFTLNHVDDQSGMTSGL